MKQQLRQLSGDTAIYGLTTIVQRFLSFLLTPFYTHFLLPGELGVQVNLFVLVAFLLVVANFGMESAFFKFDSVVKESRDKSTVFWSGISTNWIAAIVIASLLLLMPRTVDTVLNFQLRAEHLYLVQYAGVILLFDSLAMIPLASLRMRRRAKRFGGIKIAAIVVNVVANVILVGFMGMKLEGIFLAGILQSIAQFLLTMPILRSMLPFSFSVLRMKEMFRFGAPTIGSGLSMIALQLVDRVVIQNILGYDALGIYQANYRLGVVMVVLVGVFEFAWRPFFLQQANAENAKELFARVFTYFNVFAGGLIVAVALFVPNIAAIPIPFVDATFIKSTYWSGLNIVPIVLFAYLFNGWFTNFIVGVYIEKKTGALLWVTAIGAGLELLLCTLTVRELGIEGGAWSTLAAYGAMALILQLFIRRFYAVNYEWGRVTLVLAGSVGIVLANSLLFDPMSIDLMSTLTRVGLFLLYPLWLFSTRFFTVNERKELKDLLRKFTRRSAP